MGLRVLFATADRTLAKGLHRGSPYTLQAVVGPSKVYMYSAATCLTISDYPTAGIVCTANDSLSRNDKPVTYDYLISNVLCRPGYGVLYATSKGLSRKQYRTTYKTSEAVIVADSYYQSSEFGIRYIPIKNSSPSFLLKPSRTITY